MRRCRATPQLNHAGNLHPLNVVCAKRRRKETNSRSKTGNQSTSISVWLRASRASPTCARGGGGRRSTAVGGDISAIRAGEIEIFLSMLRAGAARRRLREYQRHTARLNNRRFIDALVGDNERQPGRALSPVAAVAPEIGVRKLPSIIAAGWKYRR